MYLTLSALGFGAGGESTHELLTEILASKLTRVQACCAIPGVTLFKHCGGPVRRLRSPSSADEETNACTTWSSMRRSGSNQNPSRTEPGKRSSVSSTGRTPSPGSRKTGLTLWQGSRAKAGLSAEESCLHKGVEKLIGDRPPTRACRTSAETPARARDGRCVVFWRGNGAPLRTKRAAVALECDFDSPGDAVVVAVGSGER